MFGRRIYHILTNLSRFLTTRLQLECRQVEPGLCYLIQTRF